MLGLDEKKPVVVCGDFNVAHQAIDLKNPKPNYNRTPGYTQAEIDGMSAHIDAGLVDTFRHLYPEEVKYSQGLPCGGSCPECRVAIGLFSGQSATPSKVADSRILNDVMGVTTFGAATPGVGWMEGVGDAPQVKPVPGGRRTIQAYRQGPYYSRPLVRELTKATKALRTSVDSAPNCVLPLSSMRILV